MSTNPNFLQIGGKKSVFANSSQDNFIDSLTGLSEPLYQLMYLDLDCTSSSPELTLQVDNGNYLKMN